MRTKLRLTLILTIVGLSVLPLISLAQKGKWTKKADMPTARLALQTCVLDGKIYAIGGLSVWGKAPDLSTVEVYDPATDTWERKANLPFDRYKLSLSVVDGKIYAIGGFGIWVHPEVTQYNPVADTWEVIWNMPTPRGQRGQRENLRHRRIQWESTAFKRRSLPTSDEYLGKESGYADRTRRFFDLRCKRENLRDWRVER